MTEFTYKAPQFHDFSQGCDKLDDSYFDMATDENAIVEVKPPPKLFEDITESDRDSDCFYSPIENGITNSIINLKTFRRSLSMNDLAAPQSPQQEPKLSSNASDDAIRNQSPGSPQAPSSSSMHCLPMKVSQEHINRLAQPKRVKSQDNLTLAEAVVKFQAGTPKRFRSKPSPKINKAAIPIPWCATKPQAPKFATDVRVRPVVAISKDEQEKLDMEEAKKFKIKAHPLNKRVLRGPLKPPVDKKPPTAVEPFHLTEAKKNGKVNQEPPKAPAFKAQPLPKSLHHPMKITPKGQPPTQGQSPSFSKRLSKNTPNKDVKAEPKRSSTPRPFQLGRTMPIPFSFEKRDQQLMKKKEQYIQGVFEKEKKAREFHANPLPKAILKSRTNSQDKLSEAGSALSFKSADELDVTVFKARPAAVLTMKPFEPKKDENHVIQIAEFRFSTDQRVQARHQFDEKLKEKEALAEAQRKETEDELRRREEEEVARLRKQMEHKAQPVKKYKELQIQPAHKVTQPVSPKFHLDKIRNKENIQQ